ncbi:MAG: hypothetical protein ACTSR3_23630 [Candidatus Helarchaeota archaeon]
MGAQDISFANEEECFVIKETTAGTLKKPGTDDRVYTIGPFDFGQDQEFKEDEQIRASASMLSPIKGRKLAGEFTANTYVKPSGAKGTAPEHDVFLECLMGTKTVNAGVSVVYTLANTLPSFSFWSKKGDTVYAGRGATVNTGAFTIPGDDISTITFGGNFMELLWAGTAKTQSISSSVLTMDSGGAQLYVEGMYVNVGSDDNSGAGFEITDVNYSTDKITLESAPSVSGVQTVTPWWPSSGVETGEPVFGKMGIVKVGGNNFVTLNVSVSMTNNIKYYDYEKNNVWTAEKYGRPGKREINGEIEAHLLPRGPSYRYRAEYQVSNALILPAGKTSGYIMELSVPYAEYASPSLEGTEEFLQRIGFKAIASSSLNDEFSITFK